MNPNSTEAALRSFLDQPDAVIFVGSGMSVWSGLPTWEVLLRRLIDEAAAKGAPTQLAEEFFSDKALLDAADALPLTPLDIATILRGPLGFAAAQPHEVHSLLVRLGPQRFVTTNYDSLLEQQLGFDGRLGIFRTVTSLQVAELADIIKASADTFIFKPHGDLANAESLVLASRDYDRIIGGQTSQIRQALDTLLVTRPTLFLGYGLRDPDTRLVLRTLRERYLGNIGHFTAVLADATEEHRDYWWEQYRIRVHSYATTPHASGGRDHTALLELLRRLVEARKSLSPTAPRPKEKLGSTVAERRVPHRKGGELPLRHDSLALVRYAARLIRPELQPRFRIPATLSDFGHTRRFSAEVARFHRADISEILDKCPGSFVLAGPAGSGKSFAITHFLSVCGRRLVEWDRAVAGTPPPIPVLLDARLYNHSFSELASASIPAGLDLPLLSETHEVVVIVDSIDEMPASFIDAARWPADLEGFVKTLRQTRTIYGTRRADLVGRNELPVFRLHGLDSDVVEDSLAEVGVSFETLPEELRRTLTSPFLVSLARRFLPRHRDLHSAPALLSAFVQDRIQLAIGADRVDGLRDGVAALAASLTTAGRETIGRKEADGLLVEALSGSAFASESVIDRFVAVGLMISEIGAHVRFVHRAVTEYLAAGNVVAAWRSQTFDIRERLSTRRWDNAIAWAVDELAPEEAARLVRAVYGVDRTLAYRIVAAAETAPNRLWLSLLAAILENPPDDDQAFRIAYSAREVAAPAEAAPHLRKLIYSNGPLGGWAASVYAPHAIDEEVRTWITRIGAGDLDYNYSTVSGSALAARLSETEFAYFLNTLQTIDFESEYAEDGSENLKEITRRHGFEAVIQGLPEERLRSLLRWGQNQGQRVREVISQSIYQLPLDEVDDFLSEQFDGGLERVNFALYLRLRYHKGKSISPKVPKYSKRRAAMLLSDASRPTRSNGKWSLNLLHECAAHDSAWCRGVKLLSQSAPKASQRRAVSAICPAASLKSKQRFILRILSDPLKLTPIEGNALDVLFQEEVDIPEGSILQSIKKYGAEPLRLLADFFLHASRWTSVSPIEHIDEWIDSLTDLSHTLLNSDEGLILDRVSSYVAAAVSDHGRKRILERANHAGDIARDFILTHILPNMSTISTDDLSTDSARHFLDLYLAGATLWFHSPGHIATEQFIADIVLPLAPKLGVDPSQRKRFEKILEDAGGRHDRRYFAPWMHRSSSARGGKVEGR